MRIRWTRRARCEFDEAAEFLREANPDAAMSWQEDVQRMMTMLEDFPQIGRYHRRDPDGEIREIVVGRYRFIYRLPGCGIEIRRVRHVRRDYDPMRIRDGWPTGPRAFVPA